MGGLNILHRGPSDTAGRCPPARQTRANGPAADAYPPSPPFDSQGQRSARANPDAIGSHQPERGHVGLGG